ncbi:MAG: tyrosine-type recombinase/integrase [Anaerovoracaceae bacterium]
MPKKYPYRYQFTYEGKRYSVSANTQRQLMERVQRKQEQLKQHQRITREMSVQAWIGEWLDTYKATRVADTTLANYKYILGKIDLAMPLCDVHPIHLQQILNRHAGKSKSFLRKLYLLMNELFEAAMDNGLVERNPARKLTIPKGYSNQRRSLTKQERRILEATLPGSPERVYISLLLYCGLRPSEAGRVQGKDIDVARMRLHVRGTKTAAADRFVPLPECLLQDLKELAPLDFAVTDTRGNKTTKSSRRSLWLRFVREMNITAGCRMGRPCKHSPHDLPVGPMPIAPDLTAYCLRHTYATDLEAAGVPINVARDLLGHSDISVTSKIYTHRSEEAFEAAAEKLTAFRKG